MIGTDAVKSIEDVIQSYLDGLYESDRKAFARIEYYHV